MSDLSPYRGGKRLLVAAWGIGAAGLLATGLLALLRPRQAGFSYLVAYVYWVGIAVAALALLMAFHAAGARWVVVLRRTLEAMAVAVLPLALLFLPITFAARGLFLWAAPGHGGEHASAASSAWYLNLPFFLGRALAYFVLWGAVALGLFGWSVRQDATGDAALTARQRRLAAGGLPAVGFAMTFAAYDWLMAPNPHYHSQIIGLHWFAGSIIGVFALLILSGALATGPDSFGRRLNADHFHSLGKLLLAFVAFWAWMAYSQFMLLWAGDLPERIPFLLVRSRGGWGVIGAMLIAGQFLLPFFALLSRRLKRVPRALAAVGVWALAMHYFDVYWLLMPAANEAAPTPWFTDLTAFLGVGGVAVGSAIWAVRGRFAVPVKDPFLADSLRYRPDPSLPGSQGPSASADPGR